jgi:general secretion pathway protein G
MSRRDSSGFTLIELIVVLAIIATLIAIALPRYQGSVENAKVVALQGNLRALRDSIDRYHDDKSRYPALLQDLVDAHYLKSIPVDPLTDSAKTWVPVEETVDNATGVVDVHSGAKGSTPQGVAYSDL